MKDKNIDKVDMNVIDILRYSDKPLRISEIITHYTKIYGDISYFTVFLSIKSLVKRGVVRKERLQLVGLGLEGYSLNLKG